MSRLLQTISGLSIAALIDIKTGSALRSPAGLVPKRRLAVHLAEGIADVTLADVQPRLPDAY